jgi:6-phosphogluconolactonase (cycloisomerase 2 family)
MVAALAAIALVLAAWAAIALARGGRLSFQQALFNGSGGIRGIAHPWAVAASPDGDNVYVSGGVGNTLVTFRRDERGQLHFVNRKTNGHGGVRGIADAEGLAVSPDGRDLYVAGHRGDDVAAFERGGKGKPKFVDAKVDGHGGVRGLDSATGVAVSPDGDNVYVTGSSPGSIATFKRHRRSGRLTFVNAKVNGRGGVSGLGGASGVYASPDGKSVYAASSTDDAVVTFARSRKTGRLRFLDAIRDGEGGAMLGQASDVQVSPDDRSVYVSAAESNALDTFKRSRRTGRLSFVNAKIDGVGRVNGIGRPFGLTVAPDGRNVYATGSSDNAVAAFARRRRSGKLRFLNAKVDGEGGLEGLRGAFELGTSPDGRNVYVTGGHDSSVVTFRRHK